MKKTMLILAILIACFVFITGCTNDSSLVLEKLEEVDAKLEDMQTQIDDLSEENIQQADPAPTVFEAPAVSLAPSLTTAPQLTLAPQLSPTQTAGPVAPAMYSSYAHMVSFDPATGIAEFDYFEMLRGDDAIEWLINNEGYCSVDAENEVNDYADSEFIEKNTNPQLRSIDLTGKSLILMYQSSVTVVYGAEGIPSNLGDIIALYGVDPNYVLHTHFYYITVDESSGNVTLVAKVYWP